MDIYTRTLAFLKKFPIVEAWPEMRWALEQSAAKKPHDWHLPIIGCQAANKGSADRALPAVAALACMQISIIMIDDILDDDPIVS